ncbi:PGF-CTERM sorting domain-containing protein [Halorubrum sp. CBA1125]|uniref:Hvo_1808 family surface protein n=1 Tax=Halorubrum sp. CBA1125 TaxID=2668072 RepID=UPI0012E987CA|nr:Hvo_1808 family surface protein [Halorubrum sp. CBA1125]MUW14521.1 PGF-CTERM sorting domain-containing protein [Halorubrum sp. CBA1125]
MRRARILPIVVVAIAFIGFIAVGAGVGAAESVAPSECGADDGPEAVGCWNGTHHADELGFDQSDGLTDAELEALTHLTMARVEYIRERPFERDVPVETVSRAEFMSGGASGDTNGTANGSGEAYRRWNDQVWEALFVVDDDQNANDAIEAVLGGAVGGFYSPTQDRIVIVVPEDETVQISPSTLAHELVHAMQDQYHDLSDSRYVGETQDGDLAVNGIVEGEAVHIEERYAARCGTNWTCLDEPDGGGGGSGTQPNFGILQTVLQPYSDGALYVDALVAEDGWTAVNETMNDPPESTAEVIHRNPDYETREIAYEDTATGGWETYPDQGVDGAETAGEASMFVMFWYQSFAYEHAVLEPDASVRENVRIHFETDEQLRTRTNYNYAHEVTAGWAGDELYPYRNGDRDGYVWVTEWQTRSDARAFQAAYRRMLTAHGDAPFEAGEVYEIDDGGFEGAYGLVHESTTVTIVHAPEPRGVLELRPDADLSRSTGDQNGGDNPFDDGDASNGDATDGDGTGDDATDGDTADGDATDGDTGDAGGGSDTDDGLPSDSNDSPDGDGASPDASVDRVPGFGALAALVGLLFAAFLAGRRSRR